MTEINKVTIDYSQNISSKTKVKIANEKEKETITSFSRGLISFIKEKTLYFCLICIAIILIIISVIVVAIVFTKKNKNITTNNENNGPLEVLIPSEENLETVERKIAHILESLPKRTLVNYTEFKNILKEKSWLVYRWVTDNIEYAAGSSNYKVLPEPVFNEGITVCSGYSFLFEDLLKYLGMECIYITGYSRGILLKPSDTVSSNHAWNGVKINDKWCLIDSTWGAGTVNDNTFNKNFDPYYYCTPPEQFIRTHYPDPEYEEYQLLNPLISLDDFKQRAVTHGYFFKFGFTSLTPDILQINVINNEGKVTLFFAKPKEIRFIFYTLEGNSITSMSTDNIVLPIVYEDHYDLNYFLNNEGEYRIDISSSDEHSNTHYVVCRFYLKTTTKSITDKYFPLYNFIPTNPLFDLDIQLISPMNGILFIGEKVNFSCKIKEFDKLYIIQGSEKLLMDKSSDIFSLEVFIHENSVRISETNGMIYNFNKIYDSKVKEITYPEIKDCGDEVRLLAPYQGILKTGTVENFIVKGAGNMSIKEGENITPMNINGNEYSATVTIGNGGNNSKLAIIQINNDSSIKECIIFTIISS